MTSILRKFPLWFITALMGLSTLTVMATQNQGITEVIFGHTIYDPYRWMENGDDYRLGKWVEEQRKTTEQYLDSHLKKDIIDDFLNLQTAKKSLLDQYGLQKIIEQRENKYLERIPIVNPINHEKKLISNNGRVGISAKN